MFLMERENRLRGPGGVEYLLQRRSLSHFLDWVNGHIKDLAEIWIKTTRTLRVSMMKGLHGPLSAQKRDRASNCQTTREERCLQQGLGLHSETGQQAERHPRCEGAQQKDL